MQNQIKDQLRCLAERIVQTKSKVRTEEGTKTAYIMPFLQIMGYDVFNPDEVVPEFTADVGVKVGEKVDYAIIRNNDPEILIECKKCTHDLNAENESQLLRYFSVTKAKFGILTNGIQYKFYTDIDNANQMDREPFLTVDLAGDIDAIDYSELLKFHRKTYDAEKIRKTAELSKSTSAINQEIMAEFANPSKEFVALLYKRIKPKDIFTPAQRERFTPLVKSAIDQYINSRIKEKLDVAYLETEKVSAAASALREAMTDKVVTTEEEQEAFGIVRTFAMEMNVHDRVFMRDAQTYCAILFDDNNRRPVCRFYFNHPTKKEIMLFDSSVERIVIKDISAIFSLKDRIMATLAKYMHEFKK